MIRVSQLFVLFLLALLSLTGSTAEWKDLWRPNAKQGDKRCVQTLFVQVGSASADYAYLRGQLTRLD